MNYADAAAEAVNDFATWLALTGGIPAALAFFTYTLGRPRTWWHTLLGWVLALLLLSILLVFALVLGRRLGGEYPGYQWVAIVVYGLLTMALWLVWAIIIRERRRGRSLGFVPTSGAKRKGVMTNYPSNPPVSKTSAAKAYVGAAAAGIVAGLGAFVTAVGDNVVTSGEWATIAIAVIVGAGLTGGGVYATTNKPLD